jgi:enoyl-CoA hydratase/carnithine racemase
MVTNTLEVTQEGPVLWVTLHRPEAMNAYTDEMGSEIAAAFDQADGDDSVRVVVLTAKGRVFCAGADVSAGAGSFDMDSGEGAKNFGSRGDKPRGNFVASMMNCRKPSIVAFNGSAAGVGLTLTLPCDIRIAADTAKFGFVFARRGLVPEAGSGWFLPQIVGLSQALTWCLTGNLFPASEALDKGLVSEVVAPEALLDRAREMALEIATNTSPVAVAITRRMLWRFAGDPDPSGVLAIDATLNIARGKTADVHEGVAAFLEKRPPSFPGTVSGDMPDTSDWWQG